MQNIEDSCTFVGKRKIVEIVLSWGTLTLPTYLPKQQLCSFEFIQIFRKKENLSHENQDEASTLDDVGPGFGLGWEDRHWHQKPEEDT
jgi:hypothetical protein